MALMSWRLVQIGVLLLCPVWANADSRDMVKIGGNIVVDEGMTIRDAVAVGGNVEVRGEVDGDAVSIGGSILLASSAIVRGDAVCVGGTIELEDGAQIDGSIVETGVEVDIPALIGDHGWGWGHDWDWGRILWIVRLFTLLGLLALALLVVAVIPQPFAAVSHVVATYTMTTVLWGVLGVVLIGPFAGLLVLSIFGITLIPLTLICVVCAFFVGYVAVAQVLGRRLLVAARRPDQPIILEVLVGLLVVTAIGYIPVLGWLFTSAASLIGFGGFLLAVSMAFKIRTWPHRA